jgi:hypothetical protein
MLQQIESQPKTVKGQKVLSMIDLGASVNFIKKETGAELLITIT